MESVNCPHNRPGVRFCPGCTDPGAPEPDDPYGIPPNDVPTALQPKIKHWCEGVIMGIDNSSCGCELTNKEWHIILQKLAKLTIWRNTTSHKE